MRLLHPTWRDSITRIDAPCIKSYSDLLHVIVHITDKAEAQEFLRAYEAVNPHARENIGWAVGDLSREEGRRVLELFECPHPVFGMTYPTPQEAFNMGREAAAKLLERQKNPWFVGALPK
jgi:hypothetical protein